MIHEPPSITPAQWLTGRAVNMLAKSREIAKQPPDVGADPDPYEEIKQLRAEVDRLRRINEGLKKIAETRPLEAGYEAVVNGMAEILGMSIELIKSDRRPRDAVGARRLIVWMLREVGASYPTIVRVLRSCSSHSGLLESYRVGEMIVRENVVYRALLEESAARLYRGVLPEQGFRGVAAELSAKMAFGDCKRARQVICDHTKASLADNLKGKK